MKIWARWGVVAAAVAAAGAPLGLLWAWLAPDVPVRVVAGGVAPAEAQPEGFFAADGWFILLSVGFGLVAAAALWFGLRAYRGPVMLAALAVGAVGAGLLAWWVGHKIGLSDYQRAVRAAAPETTVDRPPDLRIRELGWWFGVIPRVQGDLLVPAAAATIGYTMLAAWSRYPSLRPDQAPPPAEEDQLALGGTASSDSGTGTART